ncbi:MraY family glycosyltransferase [Halorhodospira sp. 9622]|uniref:MraY family glycosyltransferase n=1 Tax=Halorhodospira sp. 9622 TaxID=2899136 RepID=UPI001EE91A38|nr:MraY family glycosyltransferase [Halorhodospira sp. 9622]MCG5539073.1 undecaprenyl/decaprenyl-phosphate alpha-N-acetylglucosaminyl 1-phosphate transferase [Halorhodospira sp. 9622]
MTQIAVQLFLAFGVTAFLLLVLRRPALEAGLVDRPCDRKRHGRVVPLIGGICILLGFAAASLPADFGLRDYQGLFAGMTVLLLVGVVDDLVDIEAWAKFAAQVFAALLMTTWSGLVVEDLGQLFGPQVSLELGILAVPFTVLCVVGLVNAINMFDGVDGLAAGTVAAALGWLVLAGAFNGGASWLVLAGLLLASVCAFLIFNMRNPWRRKAACFLGDSGSMMLGFALAWFAVEAAQGEHALLPPVAIAWILALPVLDTLTLMGRRILRGRHPFQPDREHLHHIFYRAGFTPGQTVAVLVLTTVLLGGVGVLGTGLGVPEWVLAVLFVPVVLAHVLAQARAWRFARLMRRQLRWMRSNLRQ